MHNVWCDFFQIYENISSHSCGIFKEEERLLKAVSLLSCVVSGASLEVALNLSAIMPPIVHGLSSPLCAGPLSELFISLRVPAFIHVNINQVFIERISYTALRLLHPKYPISNAWSEQDLGMYMCRNYPFKWD